GRRNTPDPSGGWRPAHRRQGNEGGNARPLARSVRSGRQDDRGCERLGPKAESHRELPRDVLKFGRYDIEPDAAPGFFAFQDPLVAFEDPDPTPESRADPVDSSSPWERRVAPSESDLERPVRGVDRSEEHTSE